MFRTLVCVCLVTVVGLCGTGVLHAATPAKNVILMVADGAGFNTWKALSMYEGVVGKQFYDAEGWVQVAASVHSLRGSVKPSVSEELAHVQIPIMRYDPTRAWDTTRLPEGSRFAFAGYHWLHQTAPDSANTMTSLVTGQKSYPSAINVDGAGEPIEVTLASVARDQGKRIGVVSSVQYTHATPAAGAGAHNKSRRQYCRIAWEILTSPDLDVVAGCGNPDFDNNGAPIADDEDKTYDYVVNKQVWAELTGTETLPDDVQLCPLPSEPEEKKTRHTQSDQEPAPALDTITPTAEELELLRSWTLKQEKKEIQALTRGKTPERLLILPRCGEMRFHNGRSEMSMGGTLHQQRGSRANAKITSPDYDPLNDDVPTLQTLTQAALNALDEAGNDDGFLLIVEGGAVDWAMHANQLGRMVEEMLDFKKAIGEVVQWIENNGGWDHNLLVITADHDHMLWGPEAATVPFHPLQDRGSGQLPGHHWLSKSHSNALVPVLARGKAASGLVERATGKDPFYGPYLDQTDIFDVLESALTGN